MSQCCHKGENDWISWQWGLVRDLTIWHTGSALKRWSSSNFCNRQVYRRTLLLTVGYMKQGIYRFIGLFQEHRSAKLIVVFLWLFHKFSGGQLVNCDKYLLWCCVKHNLFTSEVKCKVVLCLWIHSPWRQFELQDIIKCIFMCMFLEE